MWEKSCTNICLLDIIIQSALSSCSSYFLFEVAEECIKLLTYRTRCIWQTYGKDDYIFRTEMSVPYAAAVVIVVVVWLLLLSNLIESLMMR